MSGRRTPQIDPHIAEDLQHSCTQPGQEEAHPEDGSEAKHDFSTAAPNASSSNTSKEIEAGASHLGSSPKTRYVRFPTFATWRKPNTNSVFYIQFMLEPH